MSVVLITGCSSGFGLEAALAFARRGDTVCATMRSLAKADALKERAAADGLTVHVFQLDVTDPASIARAVSEVVAAHGRIDVLVNNAGVAYNGAVETISVDRAMAAMDTNFWGAFRMIQAVVPAMRENRSGVVINVTSVAGRVPATAYTSMYSASKHALGSLSEALRDEVGRYGVRVVCIEPGFFKTEIMANAATPIDPNDPYAVDHAWVESYVAGSVGSGRGPGHRRRGNHRRRTRSIDAHTRARW